MVLSFTAAGLLAGFGIPAALVHSEFQRGVLVGGGLTFTSGAVAWLIVLLSGTAATMMGDLAEQWTAQELAPLQRHGWKLINHFGLGTGDQDHVLIGPGGVIVFETKWNGGEWSSADHDGRLVRARRQLLEAKRHLTLWAPSKKHGVREVEAVLVLWGRERDHGALPTGGTRSPDGVLMIHGTNLEVWAMRRGQLGLEVLSTFLLAVVAVLASSLVLSASSSIPLWLGYSAAAVAAGALSRRRWALLSDGWLTGTLAAPAIGFASLLLS